MLPIASPGILGYIVDGIPYEAQSLIDYYRREKSALMPKGTDGDKKIEQLMHRMGDMDNDEFIDSLRELRNAAQKGEITNLTDFVKCYNLSG